MENTHCGEDCPYKKMGFEKCPNELESWWQPSDEDHPKMIKDCAPKRMLLMMQQLYNRMDGVQKQQGEVCGQAYQLAQGLKTMAQIQLSGHPKFKDIEQLEDLGIIEKEINASSTLFDSSS